MEPIECLIIYDFLLLCWFVAWGVYTHWRLGGMLYITFFLFACGVISTIYYTAADGLLHDYSGITLMPFLYLLLCFIITSYPVMQYDLNGCDEIEISERQAKFFRIFCIFLIIVSIEPFLENMMLLPSRIGNEAAIDDMYEQRIYESYQEPLSGIGRKLFRMSYSFELLYPVILFYFLSRKKVEWLIVGGTLMMILSYWAHEMITGGRSQMVQNILYIVVVYFIMRRFINKEINRRIMLYGLSFLAIGIGAMAVVTVARYNSNDFADGASIWVWVGLYAGEGNLNFNSMMWDVTRSTHGDSTMILLRYLLGLTTKTGVADNWDAVSSLGIAGNIFYTYVGAIYTDFNRIGTVVFVSVLAFLLGWFSRVRAGLDAISLPKVVLVCICARILVLPTFYTYATIMAQSNLVCVLVFCVILSLYGRIRIGERVL